MILKEKCDKVKILIQLVTECQFIVECMSISVPLRTRDVVCCCVTAVAKYTPLGIVGCVALTDAHVCMESHQFGIHDGCSISQQICMVGVIHLESERGGGEINRYKLMFLFTTHW